MSELESELSQLDLNAATCLLTEDEIVTSLQNTANLFSARRVLVEAAQIFDENNKTIQPFNLTTQVDNYETTAKEYQEIIENKVLLEAFTKTIDQSIILDHVLKDDYGQNSDSENQIKVLFESNQLESLVTHLNDNEGVEKESQVRDLLENKSKITETLPRLKENFRKTEKDKDNIEMFNKASKYLKNMELMRNITQRLLVEYKFSEVKNDPELWAIHLRMLQRKTLADYYKSTETGEADLDVNTENNSIAEERDNSLVEDIPRDNSMTEPNESVHSPYLPNNASFRSRPVRTSVPNVGPANAAVESAPNEGQPNVSMKSVPNTSFRSGRNATFRSGLLDGSRLTRNEVSGIARLALNDTESDALNISEVNPTGVNRTEIGLDESLEMESEDEATSEKQMEQDEDESDLDEFVGKEELEEVFDEEEYEYEEIVEEEIADEEEGDEIEEEEEGEELPEDEEGGEEVENGGEERMEVDRQERLDESGEYEEEEEEITEYEEIVEEEEEEITEYEEIVEEEEEEITEYEEIVEEEEEEEEEEITEYEEIVEEEEEVEEREEMTENEEGEQDEGNEEENEEFYDAREDVSGVGNETHNHDSENTLESEEEYEARQTTNRPTRHDQAESTEKETRGRKSNQKGAKAGRQSKYEAEKSEDSQVESIEQNKNTRKQKRHAESTQKELKEPKVRQTRSKQSGQLNTKAEARKPPSKPERVATRRSETRTSDRRSLRRRNNRTKT